MANMEQHSAFQQPGVSDVLRRAVGWGRGLGLFLGDFKGEVAGEFGRIERIADPQQIAPVREVERGAAVVLHEQGPQQGAGGVARVAEPGEIGRASRRLFQVGERSFEGICEWLKSVEALSAKVTEPTMSAVDVMFVWVVSVLPSPIKRMPLPMTMSSSRRPMMA